MTNEQAVEMAPVQKMACPQCRAETGDDCIGPGQGWHLSRWDLLWETVSPTPPTQEHSPEQAPTEREGADDVA